VASFLEAQPNQTNEELKAKVQGRKEETAFDASLSFELL
jgi:hypothetical protein